MKKKEDVKDVKAYDEDSFEFLQSAEIMADNIQNASIDASKISNAGTVTAAHGITSQSNIVSAGTGYATTQNWPPPTQDDPALRQQMADMQMQLAESLAAITSQYIHALNAPICPKCDQQRILEDDYLCRQCRVNQEYDDASK